MGSTRFGGIGRAGDATRTAATRGNCDRAGASAPRMEDAEGVMVALADT